MFGCFELDGVVGIFVRVWPLVTQQSFGDRLLGRELVLAESDYRQFRRRRV